MFKQVQLRGRYRQIIDQDRGGIDRRVENDDADYIAVSNTLGINGWQLAKMKKSIPDMSLP